MRPVVHHLINLQAPNIILETFTFTVIHSDTQVHIEIVNLKKKG